MFFFYLFGSGVDVGSGVRFGICGFFSIPLLFCYLYVIVSIALAGVFLINLSSIKPGFYSIHYIRSLYSGQTL